jgi:alpha-L-fucosidase
MKWTTLAVLALTLGAAVAVAQEPEPIPLDPGAPPAALQTWQANRFGMFIHWGIYSLLGRGEWVMFNEKIPVEEYQKLQGQFNPKAFDAEAWVRLAKAAGQRYITITSKHHDGFCMFDSALTTYTSMHSPAHRDFIGELTRACQRNGMKIQYYYSLLDWHHPDYRGNFPAYLDYAFGQVRELCTNYGKIDGIWFDGGWEHSWQDWRSPQLIAMIRKLQPHALVNDRANWGGDYSTPEQNIPGGKAGARPFECCFTTNNSWGYNAGDRGFKSPQQIVMMLADIVGKGGNLLLNVGPLPTGEIQEEQAYRLRQVGEWMRKYGGSIYGCGASPFPQTPWGRCTARGNRLYIHLFDWPGQTLTLTGLRSKVVGAHILKGDVAVKAWPSDDGPVLGLPAEYTPDLIDTVVAVDLDGPPVVEFSIRQGEDGSVNLTADLAQLHGKTITVETKPGADGQPVPNIGFWVVQDDWASWQMALARGGRFQVEVEWASEVGTGGNQVEISFGPETISFLTEETGGWDKFQRKAIGTVELGRGKYDVAVHARTMRGGAVVNLRGITLKPVE